MSNLPPPTPTPGESLLQYSTNDADTKTHKTLTIFWYILAAIQALVGCIALIPIGFGLLAIVTGASSGRGDDAAAGGIVGGTFACFGFFLLIIWWGIAFLNFTVARSLPARKKKTLCFVMACLVCLGFPLGTLLGVFTLITLNKPQISASFQ
jgi:hypothetical protein